MKSLHLLLKNLYSTVEEVSIIDGYTSDFRSAVFTVKRFSMPFFKKGMHTAELSVA